MDSCYWVDTYLRVYENVIYPVNGPKLWKENGLPPILPPNEGRRFGRSSRAWRLEPDEPVRKQKKKYKKGEESNILIKTEEATIYNQM